MTALPGQLDAAVARWFNDLSTQGILTTDAELVVRSWNRALEEHSGVDASAVLGRPLFDVIPELVTRGLDGHYRAALSGEARVLAHRFHQYLIPGRPGAPVPSQSARIAPLESDGRIVGTITVVDDVSERTASEREMRSQIEAARRRVRAPRTRSASRTSSWRRCRTRSGRPSTPCSGGRRSSWAARSIRPWRSAHCRSSTAMRWRRRG